MTSKNNKTPVLYYIKLCASFQIHWWVQNWGYSPEMLNWGKNWRFFVPHELAIWWMTLKNNRAPLLYYIKLCATFQSHWHIQTGITVRKRSIRVKIDDFFKPCDLEIWWMTLKNNRISLLSNIKLCAPFLRHMWIQTGVTVRKRLNGVMASVTLTFDLDLLYGHRVCQW